MILDLSKISPALREKLAREIKHECERSAGEIEFAVKVYAESPAKQDMLGWAAGAMDVVKQIVEQQKKG